MRPYAVGAGDRLAALSALLILLALYSATFTGLPDLEEAELDFQTTSALVRTGSTALGGTPEAIALKAGRDPRLLAGGGAVPATYSRLAPGAAIVGVPFYVAGRGLALLWPALEERHVATSLAEGSGARSEYFAHVVVGWRNPLLGALTAYLLVLTSRRLGANRSAAWLAALAYGTTTFAWAQARSTAADVQLAFFLFLGFHLLLKARERFKRLRPPPLHELAFAGLALGLALATSTRAVLAVVTVAVVGVAVVEVGHRRVARAFEGMAVARPARERRPLQLAGFLAPIVVCAGAIVLLDLVRFDRPLVTYFGRGLGLDALLSTAPLEAALGLVASPGRGLLWMAPGLLVVPFGLAPPSRRDVRVWKRALAVLVFAVLLPVLIDAAWHGGWTYGPRHVLPLLPFAWPAFAIALARRRTAVQVVAGLACALGLMVQLPASLVDHTTHQDLAVQAARVAWPDADGASEGERDERRFLRTQWDWGFAAPWSHWRILRHRAAGLGEDFQIEDLFRVDSVGRVRASRERREGFRHLVWVDLAERLGGSLWPGALLCVSMLWVGVVLAVRALDRTRL